MRRPSHRLATLGALTPLLVDGTMQRVHQNTEGLDLPPAE